MKNAVLIIKILLLIITLLMIFSFALPIVNQRDSYAQYEEKPPFVIQDSIGYFFDAFPGGYNFSALHIILPIAAIVCMLLKFKFSDYISCSLFFTSATLNVLLVLRFVSDINATHYQTFYGLTMNLVCNIIMAVFAFILLVFTFAQNRQAAKQNITSGNSDFAEQLRKLENYKKQGFLSEEEYLQKREELLNNILK